MQITYNSPELDAALSALANQKRRGIMHDLSQAPATVGQLAKQQNLSLPAIHKHIRSLEEANIIVRKKNGRTNYVTLNVATLGLLRSWIDQYHTGWSNNQATHKNYISRMKE